MQLQLLVGIVDAELLKVVLLEHLEPEDVEHRHAHRHRIVLEPQRRVHALDNVVEELRVQRLRQRVTALHGLLLALRLGHRLASRRDDARAQPCLDRGAVDLEQLRHSLEMAVGGQGSVALAVFGDGEVSNVQHGRHRREDALLALRVEPDEMQSLLGAVEAGGVVDTVGGDARLGEVEHRRLRQTQVLQHLLRRARTAHLVEDVVVALAGGLVVDA
mmetsp:Transcript_85398/g.127996  ORF Transcript_85398/g.127996 Transcript_85398/m.127996 type:complete len:217 (-) Transcript_85398:546-1196(-)